MSNHIKIGCEAYIERKGVLLLGKRGNVYGKGTWALPGGHVEYMERADATLIRELNEEMGITVTPRDLVLLAVTDDLTPDTGTHYLHLTFRVDIGDQQPALCEPEACGEWRWFPLNQLPEALFPPHQKIFATIASGDHYASVPL
jgi:8-oxo-dGTP diphosphatase